MRPRSRLAPAPLGALLVLVVCAVVPAVRQERAPAEGGTVVAPFLLDAVRRPAVVAGQVLVAHTAEGERVRVEAARLVSADGVLVEVPVGVELEGDPRYGRAHALVERLPEAHRRAPRRFAAADAPELAGDAALAGRAELEALLAALRDDLASGRTPPFVAVDVPLPLDQLFAAGDPPGTRRTVAVQVDVREPGGALRTLAVEHAVTRLAPLPALPPTVAKGTAVHAGDLHVHSCHGEALGACAPSSNCAAESFEVSGSFTYAQLASQYAALGYDWFTATDHSYCVNSDAEYAAIVAEAAAVTTASFLCLPDIELSSDETGAQTGSDLGDTVCLGTTEANHMGAHGIASKKDGGGDGLLGFCDGLFSDVLDPFPANAAAVRAEGGYPIANHPTGGSYAWNSFAATAGIEAWQMHGVEVWNGAAVSGQGGDVGRWVDWLLAGRLLYAYSGSDTHDEAFAFGASHAVFAGEPFTPEGLEAVLKAGRVYLSDGHALVLEGELDGAVLPMGTLQGVRPGAGTIELRVHHDFGADAATITVFRGRVGDAAETVLCTSGPLAGSGVLVCSDAVAPTARTWYRAYSEGGGVASYTNPVFLLPSGCAYVPYGEGLGGANVATLASASAPTIGSVNVLAVSGFSPASTVALLALSGVQLPGGVPVLGGHLLIGTTWLLTGTADLVGGAGSFAFAVPLEPSFAGVTVYWQAGALDPGQPAGVAFSNGLAMPICGLLE